MRIDEIVRMQTGFKQQSKGKSIAEKTEFNVIEALMGKIKGKKGKGKNKAEMPPISTAQANPAYNLSLSGSSGPRTPEWDKLWTKREPAMSEEEFEKEIVALATEFAERSVEIGNSGKSSSMINRELKNLRDEFEDRKAKLGTPYISVVSPDRKAAYANADFTDTYSVYGNEKNIFGENELMRWNPYDGWSIWMTDAELGRFKKFNNLFIDTLDAYEKEHGVTIPYTTISKGVAPVRNYL